MPRMKRFARRLPGSSRFTAGSSRSAHPAIQTARRRRGYGASRWIALAGVLLMAGCEGPQSTLDPAGRGAQQIAELFWWMAGGAVIVWLGVVGLAVYATRVRPESHGHRAVIWIIGGGAVLPTVVLAVYLVYGLALLPELSAPVQEEGLTVAVSGELWWWRVRYIAPGGETIALANEIHLPVGERIEIRLVSDNVIHSFWVPSLGGKVDMIPGRVNRLVLEPTETGVFRGACAEYCGTSHALMSFYVVVQEKEAFARWLEHQADPAQTPTEPLAVRGREVFFANGCGACHTVRGTPADGVIGPDLTHVGSRVSLGAGILPNEPEAFLRWIAYTEEIKPGVHMPAFGMLPREDVRALAAYLEGLD